MVKVVGFVNLKTLGAQRTDGTAVTEKALSPIGVHGLGWRRCGGCAIITRLVQGVTTEQTA